MPGDSDYGDRGDSYNGDDMLARVVSASSGSVRYSWKYNPGV